MQHQDKTASTHAPGHDAPGSNRFPGPFVTHIDQEGAQYVAGETGQTTNIILIAPYLMADHDAYLKVMDTFQSGRTQPLPGYSPPADLKGAVDAFVAWRLAKRGGKRG